MQYRSSNIPVNLLSDEEMCFNGAKWTENGSYEEVLRKMKTKRIFIERQKPIKTSFPGTHNE